MADSVPGTTLVNDKETLALELRQIIQADRMAADIISDAEGTKKTIEKETKKKKADILAGAEKKRRQLEEKVKKEQEEMLASRKKQTEEQFAAQKKKLEETVRQNREKWIDDIVGRITEP